MEIEHDAERGKFYAELPAGEAYLSYARKSTGTLDLRHTVVPAAARGEGVGEALVEAALAHARETGTKIIPTCSFVRQWLREHPEHDALVERQ